MAWTDPIDTAVPEDTDPAAGGAAEFRQLKRALEQRLNSRMPGWPTTEPLPILSVDVGTLAARPAVPAGTGHVYIADDPLPKRYYYGKSGAWQELTFGSSAIADFVTVVSDALLNEAIPSSAHHLITLPIDALTTGVEVIGWRYRWRLPDYSSSWTSWQATDARAQVGLFTDTPALVELLRFEVDRADASMKFHFANNDVDSHDVDIEVVVTLMEVG